jgi:O-6-methylguanine DNA methyltransferase
MGVTLKNDKIALRDGNRKHGAVLLPGKPVMVRATAAISERSHRPSAAAAHTALVGTRWGVLGLGWCEYSQPSVEAFSTGDTRMALLVRIYLPGLPPARLRKTLAAILPNSTEVLADACGHFHPHTLPTWFGELVSYLQLFFANTIQRKIFDGQYNYWNYWKPCLDLRRITPFQEQVYNVVAGIPRGQVLSYGQVAARAGNSQAARAVGAALRANPWPLLVPCHRVVGTGGKLTGFTAPGGIDAKRKLLALEQAG